MYRELLVEWVHPPGMRVSPVRIAEDGRTIFSFLSELRPILASDGIGCRMIEREGGSGETSLLMNGKRVESLLSDMADFQFRCEGRRCEPGPSMYFREESDGGTRVLIVPEILARKAVLLALEE